MNPNRQITTTIKEQRQRDQRQRLKGTEKALEIIALLPILALRDEYGFGKKRMLRYIIKYQDILDAYNKDYITLEDIAETIKSEIDIDLSDMITK